MALLFADRTLGLDRLEVCLSQQLVQPLQVLLNDGIQSDQLGMSISDTLHALAGQMRIEWRFKAQEEARKVPVRILVPLVFLIFPAMLAVILGPSIPSLLGVFSTIQ